MCLVGVALNVSERFPLVLAANRDEFYARPTAPLDWWPEGILGGRDLKGGGTWLAAVPGGRLALVTNVRAPEKVGPSASSRGEIVRYWLKDSPDFDALEAHVTQSGFAGVNVLALAAGAEGSLPMTHISNHGRPRTVLEDGIHALSNATLDSPWPKAETLKSRLAHILEEAPRHERPEDFLTRALLDALADETIAPDDRLPNTGVGLDMERKLSPAFIRYPESGYGTRSSTVAIATGRALTLYERTHGPGGSDRTFTIEAWR